MNYLDKTGLTRLWGKITNKLGQKQDTLVSGTNIKTINNESILGNGNINISGGGSSVDIATSIDSNSTDNEAASAKAVYSQILKYLCNEWNEETTYTAEQIVLKDCKPYVCVVETATVGTFVAEEWNDSLTMNTDIFNALIQMNKSLQILFNRIPTISTLIDSTSTDSQVASARSIYNQVLKYLCPEWDETKTYNSLTFVWHEGKIYVHLSTTSATVGTFVPEEWTDATTLDIDILNIIMQMQNNIISLSNNKQDTLVAGTNIKTIEGQSVLGSGDLSLNIPTNNNQLINGAGYITGITSSNVINALGYTPYDSSNPSQYANIKIVRW